MDVMPSNQPRRLGITSLVLLSVCLAIAVHLHRLSQPVDLVDPGGARIACVSYAPFRKPGESPFDPAAFATPERIRSDLQALTPFTDCVRTYSIDQGLDAVPAIAASLGKRVLLGVWIGRDAEANRAEIQRAIHIANTHADSIDAVIVGNEVLLRREMTAPRLAELIETVRVATDVPVTYADVWEFWLSNRSLADAVDFITVHILPYWEDEPVAVGQAVAHVRDTYRLTMAAFPNQRVLLGETGWPSAGRMRGPARPGVIEQARFSREWARAAVEQRISYNLIEAFDQPWKRSLEGAMGGHWGILDSEGRPKFAWHGAVTAHPAIEGQAWTGAGLCLLVFVAVVQAVSRRQRRRWAAPVPTLAAALCGIAVGLLLPSQWQLMLDWNRNGWEWASSGAYVMLGGVGLLGLVPLLDSGRRVPCIACVDADGASATRLRSIRLWAWLRVLLLFGCAFFVLLHVFDPRYRGYPVALYIAPTLCLVLPWLNGQGVPPAGRHERLLGIVILLGLPFVLWPELPHNTQALGFSLLAGAMAVAAVWPRDLSSPGARTSDSRPSSAPKAPGSTA